MDIYNRHKKAAYKIGFITAIMKIITKTKKKSEALISKYVLLWHYGASQCDREDVKHLKL